MTDYHAKTINLVANGLGGWRLWTADDADDPAVVAVPYILAAEHERIVAEVRREALDEAAKACDRLASDPRMYNADRRKAAGQCAAAIRAMKGERG